MSEHYRCDLCARGVDRAGCRINEMVSVGQQRSAADDVTMQVQVVITTGDSDTPDLCLPCKLAVLRELVARLEVPAFRAPAVEHDPRD